MSMKTDWPTNLNNCWQLSLRLALAHPSPYTTVTTLALAVAQLCTGLSRVCWTCLEVAYGNANMLNWPDYIGRLHCTLGTNPCSFNLLFSSCLDQAYHWMDAKWWRVWNLPLFKRCWSVFNDITVTIKEKKAGESRSCEGQLLLECQMIASHFASMPLCFIFQITFSISSITFLFVSVSSHYCSLHPSSPCFT